MGRAGGSCSPDRALAMQGDELVLGPLSRQQESRLPRQNFPLNLPTNRRLCSTVGGRIVEGWAAHCCAVSAARSRAATMTNLARSSLALVLPALFGAAKSCALVNLCMICPRWSASSQPTPNQIVLLITISWSHMASVRTSRSRRFAGWPPEANCPRFRRLGGGLMLRPIRQLGVDGR